MKDVIQSNSGVTHKNGVKANHAGGKHKGVKEGINAPSQQTIVQPKLELTTPGDSYEREADRMADFVMRKAYSGLPTEMPSTSSVLPPMISRRASSSTSGVAVDNATENGIHASRGGGQPMPTALRSQMESGFGADFSGVRLHTGSAAEAMSNDLSSKAFTYGNDIFFNSGQYQPYSPAGQHLIAHELTHVVQQGEKVGRKPIDFLREYFEPTGDYFNFLIQEASNCLANSIQEVSNYFNDLNQEVWSHVELIKPSIFINVGHPEHDILKFLSSKNFFSGLPERNLSSTATNFAINIAKAIGSANKIEKDPNIGDEGTLRNAIRHALWQALITSQFGIESAIRLANTHEKGLNPTANHNRSIKKFKSLSEADRSVDLFNNEIGRNIGKKFQNLCVSNLIIAKAIMTEFKKQGLFIVEKNNGYYNIKRQIIDDREYDLAITEINKKNEGGLNKEYNVGGEDLLARCFSPNASTQHSNSYSKYLPSCRLFNGQNYCAVDNNIINKPSERVCAIQNFIDINNEELQQAKHNMTKKETEEYVFNWLRNKGFNNIQTVAIMGNFRYESNMDPLTVEGVIYKGEDKDKFYGVWTDKREEYSKKKLKEIYKNNPKVLSKLSQPEALAGGGIGQWTGNRAMRMEEYAKNQGLSKYDINLQLKWAWKENRKNIFRPDSKKWGNSINSIEEATKCFMRFFEGLPAVDSSLQDRIGYAKEYLHRYKNELQIDYSKVNGQNVEINKDNESEKKISDDKISTQNATEVRKHNQQIDIKRTEEIKSDYNNIAKYNRRERAKFLYEQNSIYVENAIEGSRIFEREADAEACIDSVEVNIWTENEENKRVSETMSLRAHKKLIPMVKKIFEEVYYNSKEDDFVILRKKTPPGKNEPVNQSAAYNWRYKRYKPNDKRLKEFSEHSSGTAIDINTSFNPFYSAKGTNKYEGTEYDKYVIKKDSLLVKTFKKYGWSWGGEWKNCKDYMHFEWFSKNFPKT